MAHAIDMSNNRANMAYAGDTPWHGLGQALHPEADLKTWRKAAGLDWYAMDVPAVYQDPFTGQEQSALGNRVLLRSDTRQPLSIVSKNYQIVQPNEVLEFYRDLTESHGFKIETAGCLFGGRRVWALAKTGLDLNLGDKDVVNNYLLLATSFDGTMATVATYTSIRVVCYNTLSISVGENGQKAQIKIHHGQEFDAKGVKEELGLVTDSWTHFSEQAQELTKRKISRDEAVKYFVDLLLPKVENEEIETSSLDITSTRVNTLLQVYQEGVGQQLVTAKDTAWGLVNAVTRYYDHERNTRTIDARLDTAWFGQGSRVKCQAWNQALALLD